MNKRRRTCPVAFPLIAAAVAACAGCDRTPPTTPAPPSAPPSHVEMMPAVEQKRHTASGEATLDVEFTLDRLDMTVAERVNGVLRVTSRAEAAVTMPTIGATLGDFNVASSETTERLEGGMRQTTVRVVLEPFLAGAKTIPALEVRAKDAGKTLSLKTEAATVKVAAVAGEKDNEQTPLEGAHGPVALLVPAAKGLSRRIFIAGAAALVAMLASFGFIIMHSRRTKRDASPVVKARRGFERVRGMLAADTSRAAAAEAAGELHGAFTVYLRDGIGLPADVQPAAQLAPALERAGALAPELREQLTALLGEMERVRFAPDAAAAPVVGNLVNRCASWVDAASAIGAGGMA